MMFQNYLLVILEGTWKRNQDDIGKDSGFYIISAVFNPTPGASIGCLKTMLQSKQEPTCLPEFRGDMVHVLKFRPP